jgi:putative PIN family toxin of toxin-antitoxin system
MRVVLDTNVLVSALISAVGSPAKLLDAWRAQRFTLVSSNEQLEEFRAVTRHRKLQPFVQRTEAGRFVRQLRLHAVVLERLPRVDRSSDPTDNFLLAMAEAASADYLVSGDRRGVLALSTHGSTHIINAREMLAVLGSRPSAASS